MGSEHGAGINYIRCAYGEGFFYFHSIPTAFTNYNILRNDNADYISKALSYLPIQTTYWDEYHKAGKKDYDSENDADKELLDLDSVKQ